MTLLKNILVTLICLSSFTQIARANPNYFLTNCSVEGLIIENQGFYNTINLASNINIVQDSPTGFHIHKNLSSTFNLKAQYFIAHNKLILFTQIYKGQHLFLNKKTSAILPITNKPTYYTAHYSFSDVKKARPALNDSLMTDIKLQCLLEVKSNWFW